MNKIMKIIVAMLVLCLPYHGPLAAQEEPATKVASATEGNLQGLSAFVDATIKAKMEAHDVPAGTISIVKDGKVIFAKGYGLANIEEQIPVTAENTLFRPGSTSKLFTWTAVMQQVEAGNLDLDADVNIYLKSFQIPATYDEPITLKHILSHTAGFEEGGLGYLISYDPESVLPLREAMAKYIPRRINKPGDYASYSNYATALAGLIVENVSGVPFNDYIKRNIFDPLGMENSSFAEPLPVHLDKNMAIGYKRKMGVNTGNPFELITGFGPAGAMSSTAADMAKFMIAHLNNGRFGDAQILKPETAELMHTRLYAPDDRAPAMAYGFYENFTNGHRLIGHGGDTFQFHSNLMIDKAENFGIFVSFVGDGGAKVRSAMVQAIYDEFSPQPIEEITPPADFNDRAARYAGSFKFWRHNQSGIEKVSGIAGGLTITPTGKNTLLVTGLFEPRQYVEIDKNLFRQVDGKRTIFFGEDSDGNIQDFHVGGLPFMEASRPPAIEGKFFAQILPIAALILFLTVWTGWIYRRKEFKAMSGGEKTAIRLSLGMSASYLLFAILTVVVLTVYAETLYSEIPFVLKLVLVLPNIALLLSAGVAWFAVKSWQEDYWRRGRKIHYTLVAVSAVYMSWFCYYWNLLGIQLPG